MTVADHKLDTMPIGSPAYLFGIDAAGLPVLTGGDARFTKGVESLRLVNVRGRGALPGASAGYASAFHRYWDVSHVPVRQVQFPFMNWFVDQADGVEKGPGGPTTVAISIEYPRGTFKQITWGGAASKAVADGATEWTDIVDLGFTIPAYAKFWVRIYWANAVKMIASSHLLGSDLARGDAFVFNGSNQTMSGATIVDNGSATYHLRLPMMSYSNRVVRATFGDSITAGVNTTFFEPHGGTGLYGVLAKLGPLVNFGVPGDKMFWFNASSSLRVALANALGVHQATNGYGINDINSGRSSVNLTGDRETLRGKFSFPVFDTTILPQVNTTDAMKTAANQTTVDATKNTQRTINNTAVRAGIATSPGLIDIAAMLETDVNREYGPKLNGGVCIPRFYDVDGVHPHTFAAMHVAPAVEALFMSMAA